MSGLDYFTDIDDENKVVFTFSNMFLLPHWLPSSVLIEFLDKVFPFRPEFASRGGLSSKLSVLVDSAVDSEIWKTFSASGRVRSLYMWA